MRQVSWLALAAALAISAPAISAPPPIFVPQPPPLSPPPPPSPSLVSRSYAAPVFVNAPEEPVRKVRIVEVRVTAGGQVLVADRFRIREGQGASLNTNRNEASNLACKSSWQSSEGTGVSLSIYAQSSGDTPNYRISFSWTRPGPNDTCDSTGTQRVGIEQTVNFAKASRVTIRGDADTVIELRLIGEAP